VPEENGKKVKKKKEKKEWKSSNFILSTIYVRKPRTVSADFPVSC